MPVFPRATQLSISKTAWIGPNSQLGVPDERRILTFTPGQKSYRNRPVSIGRKAVVGCNVVIYEGVRIADETIIEDGVCIGPDSVIGRGTRLCYGAIVCDQVSIGENCVVGGFVCDEALVGSGSRIFGALVHEQSQPHRNWWDVHEKAPRVREHTTIGWNAVIVGNITVGPYAYVAAGAVVTKSVATKTVVLPNGTRVPARLWKGRRLRVLIRWWGNRNANR
jgi:acetyltransferase-like isoleucine patch superfamily enzyme